MPLTVYAQTYLHEVEGINAAVRVIHTLGASITDAQRTDLSEGITSADDQLLSDVWPNEKIRNDVRALVRDHGAMVRDLSDHDGRAFDQDEKVAIAAASVLRADFGLPLSPHAVA